jgi:hypothetical protein
MSRDWQPPTHALRQAEEYTRPLDAERIHANYGASHHLQAAQGEAMRKLIYYIGVAIVSAIDRRPRG